MNIISSQVSILSMHPLYFTLILSIRLIFKDYHMIKVYLLQYKETDDITVTLYMLDTTLAKLNGLTRSSVVRRNLFFSDSETIIKGGIHY